MSLRCEFTNWNSTLYLQEFIISFRRHILNKKRIIALPVYKADPILQKECLYAKHTVSNLNDGNTTSLKKND